MRKGICLLLAMLLCAGLAVPGFAAEFVPSITYKPVPEITGGVLIDPENGGEKVDIRGCIIVTSILEAEEKKTDITQAARDLLLEVYEKLSDGSMELFALPEGMVDKKDDSTEPTYKDMGMTFDRENYAVFQLVDVSFRQSGCVSPRHLHKEGLAREGVTVELEFDVGVTQDANVLVLWFDGEQWAPVESTVNNGDGTVTCVFEDLCPVAFCIEAEAPEAPEQPDYGWLLWLCLLLACAGILVALVIYRQKNKNAEE